MPYRFGLWVVDLTVSQILQEMVEEDVRGVINGVQDSMNNALDLTKCVLVILLPAQETFGLLIIASFVSINIGYGQTIQIHKMLNIFCSGGYCTPSTAGARATCLVCAKSQRKFKVIQVNYFA